MQPRIIVALDQLEDNEVDKLISQCHPKLCRLKVGITQFTQRGPAWIKDLHQAGFELFLDLKFHDIPQQVYGACFQASRLGVWMLNVHASGGLAMLKAAKAGVTDGSQHLEKAPLLIGVTVLTSLTQADLAPFGSTQPLNETVLQLATQCMAAGLDGVVCSAQEAMQLKETFGASCLCVTPGIRLKEDATQDQQRVMDPVTAIQQGSDYLVIGRSITHSDSPNARLKSIHESIQAL